MHVGRISHPDNTLHHRQPVAPSAVKPAGQMFTASGPQDMPEPRALSQAEIAETIRDFRKAARSAIEAGADGVELHGANGYLIDQFLSENANRRVDSYGGSIANRIRFAVEVAAGVAEEIGADRTAIRLSPGVPFNDIVEGDTPTLYRALLTELARLGLAYVHFLYVGDDELLRWLRPRWPTSVIVNRPGRAREQIASDIDAGLADMVSVATLSLANPDLVARLKAGAPLNEADRSTFYGGGEHGYIDYPTL
jgi:N-ethylmaleimide reductase